MKKVSMAIHKLKLVLIYTVYFTRPYSSFSLIHNLCMSQTIQVVWVKVVGYGRHNVHLIGVLVPVLVLSAVKRRVAANVLRGGPPGVLKRCY